MERTKFKNIPNLITISGKAGSGKDTVERMIQAFMIHGHISNRSEIYGGLGYDMLENDVLAISVLDGNHWYGSESYTNKKFADKLKDIVCLLIGCDRKQLEDRDFKESPLGEQWVVWKIQASDELEFEVNNLIDGGIFVSMEEAEKFIKEHELKNIEEIYKVDLTPRLLLQLMGTECGRQMIHPNIWVNALFSEYTPIHHDHVEGGFELPRWIITDVRFKNEVDIVEKKGGLRIRVNRTKKTSQEWQTQYPDMIVYDPDGWDRKNYQYSWHEELITLEEYNSRVMRSTCMGKVGQFGINTPHASEVDLDDYNKWDYVIENDGSLRDLLLKVHEMLMFFNKKYEKTCDYGK